MYHSQSNEEFFMRSYKLKFCSCLSRSKYSVIFIVFLLNFKYFIFQLDLNIKDYMLIKKMLTQYCPKGILYFKASPLFLLFDRNQPGCFSCLTRF